jgi:putative ABC transport system permease protein
VVRTAGNPGDATRTVREAVWSVDPAQPIARVATMEALIATSAAERRFARALFQAFALAALVLAAAGVYGVVSGSVAERVREIGVRAALGASRADILGMVVGQGLSLAGLGVAAGLVGAVSASGALVTLLFGVTRLDPVTYLGVIALVAAVAAVASAVPAWRAARIDPSITLKGD